MIVVNRQNWNWYVENEKRGRPGFFAFLYTPDTGNWSIIEQPSAKDAKNVLKSYNEEEYKYLGYTSIHTYPAELVRQLQNKVLADCWFFVPTYTFSIDLLQYVEKFPENRV